MRGLALASVIIASIAMSPVFAGQGTQADEYFLEGKWKKAVSEYRVLIDAYPTVDRVNRLGEAYFYGNEFEAAEKTFKKAIDIEDNVKSRTLLAMVRAVMDEDRLDELANMERENGESALFLRSMGAALLHHKRHDEAMDYFQRAKQKDPDDYMTHFYIGLIHERKHRYDDGMPAYKESIRLNPRFAQAVNNLGYCFKERHYYTYAIKQYEEAVAIEPDNANFHYNLGNAQTHKDMIREALESYSHAVRLDPKFAKAHYNLGRSYIGLDMLEEGIKELKLYLKYFDKSLLAADAPPPAVVKEEIQMLKDMIEERDSKGAKEGDRRW